jgi:hypothetical protein
VRADGSSGEANVRFRYRKAESWYIVEANVVGYGADHPVTAEMMRDVPLARITAAANADPAIHGWLEAGAPADVVKRARSAAKSRPRLERPSRRALDDAFYQRVADAYRGALANGLPPAKTLASDSGAPQGTVNRWVAAARERGYLSETSPGKVSV